MKRRLSALTYDSTVVNVPLKRRAPVKTNKALQLNVVLTDLSGAGLQSEYHTHLNAATAADRSLGKTI